MNRCKKLILRIEGFHEAVLEHKKQAAALTSKQGNRTVVLFHKGLFGYISSRGERQLKKKQYFDMIAVVFVRSASTIP